MITSYCYEDGTSSILGFPLCFAREWRQVKKNKLRIICNMLIYVTSQEKIVTALGRPMNKDGGVRKRDVKVYLDSIHPYLK